MNPALIEELVSLILQLGPLALNMFLKLEPLLNITTDEKANIANAIASSNKADQDTINAVAAWMATHGFVPQVKFVVKAAA